MFLASLGSACSDPALANILATVKRILSFVQIIGPILAIVSLSIHLVMLVKDPDDKDKKKLHKIHNSIIALMVLFFVPVIVNAAFSLLGDNTNFSSCWNNASTNNNGRSGNYVSPYNNDENKNRSNIISDPSEYEKGKKIEKSNTSTTGGTYSSTGDRSGSGNMKASKVLFIGDSRTVQMYAYLNSDWGHANYSSGGVHVVGSDIYVAEGAMGLNWMKNTGIPAAQGYFSSGTAIVILMGVNDLGNANNYINYVNSNVSNWKRNGSSLYYVSVNPCNGKYSNLNPKIESFNAQVKGGLSNEVGWIDTYSHMYKVGFNTTDGLHYDKSTYQTIYNYIKSKV